MKKDFAFASALLAIGVVLCLLQATGMVAHIVVSVVGVLTLIAYTVLTKKDWKIPALEISMRASYGLSMLTGIIIKIKYVAALAVFHKVFAILFMALIVVLLSYKVSTDKEA